MLQQLGVLEPMMERWFFTYSKLYVYIVEEKLAEALTSFKVMEEGEYIRRNHTRLVGVVSVYLVHVHVHWVTV